MLPSLPQDIFVNILDALDDEYTSTSGSSNAWHSERVSTLQNITLVSRTLCTVAQPRLFAHIDFDAGEGAQGRAVRLLRYFLQDEGNGANLHSHEISQSRLQSIRSFRFRDGRGASEVTPIPQTHWKPDLATPLGRLLSFFVDVPNLRLFAFEGDLWTLAGAGELVGYQSYIHMMSSKPSLRALALTNAYDIPIDVFFMAQSHQQLTPGIRMFYISNVSFSDEGRARHPVFEGATTLAISHPIKHIKLGRLNYSHLFDMIQMRCDSLRSLPLPSTLAHVSPFHRLTSLSLAVSVVPAQMIALWNFVYGLRETLEHLQIRSYESISDKPRSSTLKHADTHLLGFGQKFSRLSTLTISTYILGKSTRFMDSAGSYRWGLPLIVDLLEPIMGCSIPRLQRVNLELFFVGGGEASAQTDEDTKNVSLDEATANSIWRAVDTFLMSIVGTSPSLNIGVVLLPFFCGKRRDFASAALTAPTNRKCTHTGDTLGLDERLPNAFAKAPVDVRVNHVLSEKDMLTYLQI